MTKKENGKGDTTITGKTAGAVVYRVCDGKLHWIATMTPTGWATYGVNPQPAGNRKKLIMAVQVLLSNKPIDEQTQKYLDMLIAVIEERREND